MENRLASLNGYVWKFCGIYFLSTLVLIVIESLFELDLGKSMSVVVLMTSAMATRMIFIQKELRLLEKVEKNYLVKRCFIAAWLISAVWVFFLWIYLVVTGGMQQTNAELAALWGAMHLPVWIWLIVIVVVSLLTYFAIVVGFSDFFKSDNKMLEAIRKKNSSN